MTTVETLAPVAADRPLPGALPLTRTVRRQRGLFIALPAVLMLLGAAIGLLSRTTYTSNASFLPTTGGRSGGALASIGAQFGLAIPGSDPAQSPAFYTDLLTSEVLLRQVAQRRYKVTPDGAAISLADLYEVGGSTPAAREDNAIRELRKDITTAANAKTGVVRFSVRAENPLLAQTLGTELLRSLESFNNQRRRSTARAERQFTEQRLREVSAQLARAEDRLLAFRARNREFSETSGLLLEETRLQREVSLLTQLTSSLAQAFEQARIDEVRNTPLVSPIESPSLPVRRDARGVVRLGLTGAVLGFMLALALSFGGRALRPVADGADRAS